MSPLQEERSALRSSDAAERERKEFRKRGSELAAIVGCAVMFAAFCVLSLLVVENGLLYACASGAALLGCMVGLYAHLKHKLSITKQGVTRASIFGIRAIEWTDVSSFMITPERHVVLEMPGKEPLTLAPVGYRQANVLRGELEKYLGEAERVGQLFVPPRRQSRVALVSLLAGSVLGAAFSSWIAWLAGVALALPLALYDVRGELRAPDKRKRRAWVITGVTGFFCALAGVLFKKLLHLSDTRTLLALMVFGLGLLLPGGFLRHYFRRRHARRHRAEIPALPPHRSRGERSLNSQNGERRL